MKRFVFCYAMAGEPARIREVVPVHVAYWKEAGLRDYAGGPFADRSGGLITFAAADLRQATSLAERDPFLREGLLGDWWVREWLA